MEDEIDELKEEIRYLQLRVEELEKSNNRRKAYGYAKILSKICLILLAIYGIWRGYEYIVSDVPRLVEDKIKEISPTKSIN